MYKKILRMIPIYLLLIIIALMVVLPIIWVVLSGFKYEQDIISWPPSFFPRKLTNENWETIKSRIDIVKYIVNSVVYSVGKYSLQGTTQGRYLTGGVPLVRFSM